MAIKAILLIPTEGDPHGLLAEGPCGARPPRAISGHLCGYEEHRAWKSPEDYEYHSDCYMCSGKAALVLAWGGNPVREGCYRVAHANDVTPSAVPSVIKCALEGDPILRSIAELGTIVLLDAEGKEIADAP